LRLTADPRHDYNPVWSPDGRWVAFLRGDAPTPLVTSVRELRLVAPLGGPERMVASLRVQELTEHPAYLTWCADSSCVVVSDSLGEGKPDALFAISIDTGEKRQLTNPQPPVLADSNPALSFDGNTLLFIRRTTWSSGELHTLSLASKTTVTGEPRHVTVSGVTLDSATWLPSGEILFAPVLSGTANLWRVCDWRRAGAPGLHGRGWHDADSGAGNRHRLAHGSMRRLIDDNIWQMTTTGRCAGRRHANGGDSIHQTRHHPQLSPDGKRLAFTSTRSGFWEIWVSDLDGANAVQLTNMRAPTGTGVPHWSPDAGSHSRRR
jgi:Tol biopolymer transport system component